MSEFCLEQVDRLVDGELSDQQRRELLVACEAVPPRWRDVALAFLEAQALSTDLRGLAAQSNRSGQPMQNARRQQLPAFVTPLAFAASLLFTLVVGYQLGTNLSPVGDSVVSTVDQSGPAIDEDSPQTSPVMSPEAIQLVLRDPMTDELNSVEVELTPQSQLPADFFRRGQPTSAALRTIMQNAGHKLEHRQRYLPVELSSGRQGIIPVDSYQITFDQYQ